MVLDVMLPGLGGLEVCKQLRAANHSVPILMLTARDEDIDKILGLELGADDYLTKPFNPRELVARVKAILRREERTAQTVTSATLQVGDLTLDPARREVRVKGQIIVLRHQEFNLLHVFVQHKGLVLTREQILNLAWGYDYAGQTRTVDVHVGHLRKKLATSSLRIETMTSDGYKLVE
jgi:DNA-binding response OmpR family regulator